MLGFTPPAGGFGIFSAARPLGGGVVKAPDVARPDQAHSGNVPLVKPAHTNPSVNPMWAMMQQRFPGMADLDLGGFKDARNAWHDTRPKPSPGMDRDAYQQSLDAWRAARVTPRSFFNISRPQVPAA